MMLVNLVLGPQHLLLLHSYWPGIIVFGPSFSQRVCAFTVLVVVVGRGVMQYGSEAVPCIQLGRMRRHQQLGCVGGAAPTK